MARSIRRSTTMLAAALLTMVPAPTAHAGTVTFVFEGAVTFDAGISAPCTSNNHPGTFVGTITGTHSGTLALGTISATFLYCDATAIAGTAEGTFTVVSGDGSTHHCGFTWVRTVNFADVTISGGGDNCSGSAFAIFAPTTTPAVAPAQAGMTGEGSWTH